MALHQSWNVCINIYELIWTIKFLQLNIIRCTKLATTVSSLKQFFPSLYTWCWLIIKLLYFIIQCQFFRALCWIGLTTRTNWELMLNNVFNNYSERQKKKRKKKRRAKENFVFFLPFLAYYILKKCSLLNIENNSSWVYFTHFREKTRLLALELVFVSSRWRVYMHRKFDI